MIASAVIKEKARSEYLDGTNFGTRYAKIWGLNGGRKEDKRTAQQIIDDTTKAMGIKVIKRRR